MQAGRDWIAADPKRWLGLVDDKLGHTFDHESFPIGYLGEADPKTWPEDRKALGRGVLSWSYRLLLTLAAFGVIARPSRARPSTLLAALALLLVAFVAAATPSHPFWLVAVAIPSIAAVRFPRLAGTQRFAAGAIASVALTHAVFFGEDRYHLVIIPFLALLASGAFADRSSAAARDV